MKVLVVGGTGANTAVDLSGAGHAVTVAGRHEPDADSPVAGRPVLVGDYAHDGFDEVALAPFDAGAFRGWKNETRSTRSCPAGEPADIAAAEVCLASAEAGWVTGQCRNVDSEQLIIR